MEGKNTFKIWLFVIFLLTIIIGGYFLMQKYTHLDRKTNLNNNDTRTVTYKDIRIDNTKDYIYFSDKEEISEELDINYYYVNINFEDTDKVAEKLNNEMEEMKNAIKYDKTNEEAPYDGLINAHYPLYNIYSYEDYVSLVCSYFEFDLENLMTYEKGVSYVYDKKTGDLLSSARLLALYDLTVKDAKERVKKFVSDADIINGDEELDVETTLNNLTFDTLFIDKLGRLSLSIIVKSSEKDYNDVVILS